MKIVLVRHGESEINRLGQYGDKVYSGQYNTLLTQKGIEQAIDLRNHEELHHIDVVYSSDLDRALETARLTMITDVIFIDKRLRERSLGLFEGKAKSILMKQYPDFEEKYSNEEFRHSFVCKAPNGENYSDVCERCLDFLNTVNLEENTTIAIFSHFVFIRCLIYVLTGMDKELTTKLKIENCSPIVLVGSKTGEFKLEGISINDLIDTEN